MIVPQRRIGVFVWAVAGVAFIVAEAAWRLALRGVEAVRGGLEPLEWAALAVLLVVFVYGEGVKALQRRWAPYVVERAQRVRSETSIVYAVLAPLYAMALIGPTRRTLARAWAGVAAIIAAVLIVSRFPDPWRGIVDTAVAAALLWGVGALLVRGTRVLKAQRRGA